MENEKYLDLLNLKIEYDNILSQVPLEHVDYVKELLDKKYLLKHENGFFTNYKLNRINKKIKKYLKKAN